MNPPKNKSLQKHLLDNISSSPPKKWAEKVRFFHILPYLCPSPKKHPKVPPEEQVAFNVMEAHSTGRLAKGAVGIQGGNR